MKDFAGKTAIVTGGGTGMGRELVRQLVAEGCNVATCDVSARNMAETVELCMAARPPQGTRVTAHVADVSIEQQLQRFRDEFAEQHETDKLHLLFNNAGIGGGGSMINDRREDWEKTFNVCWGGVYFGVRTFLPMMMRADEAHIVNTSSVNGFWASLGPNVSHTAYAAAKFAVKGFSEALITDLRLNAPHIKCSVVMPGHIGTSIAVNTRKVMSGNDSDTMSAEELARARQRFFRRRHCARAADRRGHPGHGRRRRPAVPGGRPDDRRGRGHGDPRRGQGRALAHPGGRRRPSDGRNGQGRAGKRLRTGLLSAPVERRRLAAGPLGPDTRLDS